MATLAQWRASIVDDAGNIQSGATVTVRRDVAGAPLATIYSDRAGATPVGNPIAADIDGFVSFHVIGGVYRITATKGAFTREWRYVAIGRAAEADQVLFGVPYLFDDATADADPGDGQLRFNNATYGSVSTIFIDLANALAADMTAYIDTWDDSGASPDRGVIIIQSRDGTNYWMGTITGSVTTATGYRKISVTYLGHAGTFLVDEAIGVVVIRRGVDGAVSGPGSSVDNNLAQFNGTGGNAIEDSGVSITTVGSGKQSIWVPASGIFSSVPPSTGNLNMGGAIIPYLAFDATAAEFAFFNIGMPKSWNEGTLTAKVYWAHPATTVNFGVSWSVSAAAFGNDDLLANAYVGQDITDTGGTTSDLYITSETGAIDPGNTQVEGDLVLMLISRDPTAGADTLAVDAFLIGIMIHYTTNANTDA